MSTIQEIKRDKIDKWHYKNKLNKIVKALEDEDVNPYASKVLAEMGETVLDLLHKALIKLNDVGRFRVAELLGKIGDSQSVDHLIEALNDDYGPVRFHAAEALGKIGDERAIKYLIELFYNEEEHEYIMEGTYKAVGKIGGSKTTQLLLELIDKRDMSFHAATKALVIIGGRIAVDPLINCLSDGSYLEKQSAAEALGKLGDPRALKPLEELLDISAPVWTESGDLIGNPIIEKALKRLKKNKSPSID